MTIPTGQNASSPSARTGGFTLIETVVVLVILGLAMGVVASFIPRRNDTLEIAMASDRIAGMLRLMHMRAIADGRPVLVGVTRDGHGVTVDGTTRIVLPTVVLTMRDASALRFAPDGSAAGGTIVVAGAKRSVLVRADWLTGRVSTAEVH